MFVVGGGGGVFALCFLNEYFPLEFSGMLVGF